MIAPHTDSQLFWQQQLKTSQLGAMSHTVQQIQALLGQDDTSAEDLAAIILTDVTLTSRVLAVANSVIHRGQTSSGAEGTLTQAIVQLGFSGLRAICISAAVMDTVLKQTDHRPELHDCISDSFDTAIHARNVAEKTGLNAEQAFVAGLLQNLGELVFWCSSIPDSEAYQQLLEHSVDSPEQAFKRLSGMDFEDMSKALAREWNLGELLQQTFSADITPATKAIHLGRRISQASKQGWESPQINQLLQDQLKALGFDIIAGMNFMKQGAEEAARLAGRYQPEPAEQTGSDSDQQADDLLALIDVDPIDEPVTSEAEASEAETSEPVPSDAPSSEPEPSDQPTPRRATSLIRS